MDIPDGTQRQLARITISGGPDYLGAGLAFLREAARALGLGDPDVLGLERAVRQVCENVIERAFEPGQSPSFDLVLLREPGRLVVAVEDQGLPFDFETLEKAGTSSLSGPSLAFADAIHFSSLGNRGNRVEIAKRLPLEHVEAHITEADERPATPATAVPLHVPVGLRLMTADDAVAVARCTYRCYGYTLPDDYLYFPGRIREMLAAGMLEVCIGVTPDGEVASLLTLETDHAGAAVGYLGEGMVDPRFRGHGLLERMLGFLKQRAAARGMLGLYAEAVTVHPFSQKANLGLGACETGVQLAEEAQTVVFEHIAEGTPKKRTATVLYYFQTQAAPPREVYPPAQHQAIVARIYQNGRLPRDLRSATPASGTLELPARAQLRVEVFPGWKEASLIVTGYGSDLADLVRFRLRELCLRRIDWIRLDLPLSHPAAQQLCASLEALGFFFVGIIPDLVQGDVLRLQYLNNVDPDLDSTHVVSDFGKELFRYVVDAMTNRAR